MLDARVEDIDMAATCAQGALSRLYVEPGAAPHTFDGSSETYEFLYETMQKRGRIVGGKGIRGTRSSASERTRTGAYEVGGRIAMNVDTLALDLWLPRILGATESANSFALDEALPEFGVLIDKVTETFEYKSCKVARAMFHAKAGPGDDEPELLELVLDIVGKDRAKATAVPNVSISTASNASPYVHSDAVFTFSSAAREVKEWWVLIDNHLHVRWVNSLSATMLCPANRTIAVRARLPFDTDTENLLDQAVGGATGTIALTNAAATGLTTTFTFGVLQVPPEDPVVRGKTEIDLFLNMIARTVTTTKELVVTNDSVA
jgi:hypothetical protein